MLLKHSLFLRVSIDSYLFFFFLASQLGYLSKELQATLGVLSAALIISLAWNIFCCVSKFGSGNDIIYSILTQKKKKRFFTHSKHDTIV